MQVHSVGFCYQLW